MSTENYVKYISEQVHKEKVRGFTDATINEDVELTSEDYINMLHMYIEDLESYFEDEDLQQIQELSQDTMKSYAAKAAVSRDKSAASVHSQQNKSRTAYNKVVNTKLASTGTGKNFDRAKFDAASRQAHDAAENDPKVKSHDAKAAKAEFTHDKRSAGLRMASKKIKD
jgi:hypothetical protein